MITAHVFSDMLRQVSTVTKGVHFKLKWRTNPYIASIFADRSRQTDSAMERKRLHFNYIINSLGKPSICLVSFFLLTCSVLSFT